MEFATIVNNSSLWDSARQPQPSMPNREYARAMAKKTKKKELEEEVQQTKLCLFDCDCCSGDLTGGG
jgi:hypothetical protein